MPSVKRFYGIKFPFTADNEYGTFIDLNNNADEKLASEILHVILTPKRTRLRMPDFGTDLAKYIFDQNDSSITWSNVENEAKTQVSKYVRNAILKDISVYNDEENDNALILYLKYSANIGNNTETELAIKL